jgi:hypothetical protein
VAHSLRACPPAPHALHRTFASLLFAIGEEAPYVMAQMGHTDPPITLGIYARVMARRDGEPERLKALLEGRVWTHLDRQAAKPAPGASRRRAQTQIDSRTKRP